MKLLTFKGGIHPPYRKEYSDKKVLEKAESPKVVYIPLQQHIGYILRIEKSTLIRKFLKRLKVLR